MNETVLTIILAEDDDGQATLVQRNLERVGIVCNFSRVRNGQEALDLLYEMSESRDKLAGGRLLLILDVKMPKMDGIELLRHLKRDPSLAIIPVIMLTTTDDPKEIERCYELGCNIYVTKPVGYDAFTDAIKRLGEFLRIVRFPHEISN